MVKRVIAVVHDRGAAGVVDVVTALEGVAEPLFVCPAERYSAEERALMADCGRICDIAGLSPADAVAALRSHAPAGIVTFSEYQLRTTAWLADELGLPFHSLELVRLLQDKHAQRETLNACGASSVRTRLVTDRDSAVEAARALASPAVLKPMVGSEGRNTFAIRSEEDLHVACAQALPGTYVLEEAMPGVASEPWGDYVSVESAVLRGRAVHFAVVGKFPLAAPFRETGSFLPAAIDETLRRRVLAVVDVALDGLGIRQGLCHTEVKLTPHGPQVIEVNGRLGGFVNQLVGTTAGQSVVRLGARLALDDPHALDGVDLVAGDGVSFCYTEVPPQSASRVADLPDIDELRDVPGISRVIVERGRGEAVDWRRGRAGHIYVCYGVVDTHKALVDVLDAVSRVGRVSYR